jgi:hypothetical protein
MNDFMKRDCDAPKGEKLKFLSLQQDLSANRIN